MKIYATLFTITCFFTLSVQASPWNCLYDKVLYQLNLPAYVTFWHGDKWLTEAYTFNTDQDHPLGTPSFLDLKLSALGKKLQNAINGCGCTDSLDVLKDPRHVEGLCWKVSASGNHFQYRR